MRRPGSEALSPVRTAPSEVRLPYGLTWADVGPCLPRFDETKANEARALLTYGKQGLSGGVTSCILSLEYPSEDRRRRTETVFIKQAALGVDEAAKLDWLVAKGVSTPRLLKAVRREAAEILILEFLPRIGIDFQSEVEVDELLRLVARVNAVGDTPVCFEPHEGVSPLQFDGRVRDALAVLAAKDPSVDPETWFESYRASEAAVTSVPTALNHGELYFQHVGWSARDDGQQLVLFDLATMSRRPRFTDIATILRPLALHSGNDELSLFDAYLDVLEELTGRRLKRGDAVRELRLVRTATRFHSLPWLTAATAGPDPANLMEDLVLATACLRDDMAALGFSGHR